MALMRCTCIFRRSTCICGNPPEAPRIAAAARWAEFLRETRVVKTSSVASVFKMPDEA